VSLDVARKLNSEDVLERLTDLFVHRGVPRHVRSDKGSEFTAKQVRSGLDRLSVKTLYIEPGSPCENGCIQSFHDKLRDELLHVALFDTLREARMLIERWRVQDNTFRFHSSLGYRPPLAPAAIQPWPAGQARASLPTRAENTVGVT